MLSGLIIAASLELGQTPIRDHLPASYREVTRPSNLEPIAEARDEYMKGHTWAAITLFEKHLKGNPDDALRYELLGGIYMDEGRFKDASKQFREVVRLRFDEINPLMQLAIAYSKSRDTENYARTLDTLLNKAPSHKSAHAFRGTIYLKHGKEKEAVEHFNKAGKTGAVELAKYYTREGDLKKAITILEKASHYPKDETEAKYRIAIRSQKGFAYKRADPVTADQLIHLMLLKLRYKQKADPIRSMYLNRRISRKEFKVGKKTLQMEYSGLFYGLFGIPKDEHLFELFMQDGGFCFESLPPVKCARLPRSRRLRPRSHRPRRSRPRKPNALLKVE